VSGAVLEIRDLQTHFFTQDGVVRAVDGVSLELDGRETLAVVGESGSGKSVTALSILGLIPSRLGRIVGGSIRYRERELVGMPSAELRKIRGKRIAMIFQEPMTSLNPVYSCGEQIIETVTLHEGLNRRAARERAIEMLRWTGIPSPEQRVDEYPHQMSGGMRQRVMIAMALACRPDLLIADEPTTALDVTIQAQILDLLRRLQSELGMGVLLITHDLGVVAETADRVAVMYAGQVAESCGVRAAFERPLHPYTAGLLASLPRLGSRVERLRVIPGQVPDPAHHPQGCRFHPRCPLAEERCRREIPPLLTFDGDHQTRCWRAEEIAAGHVDAAGSGGATGV
jgi:oligopeptide/dipeptide ABC transporter ATP-binding protein